MITNLTRISYLNARAGTPDTPDAIANAFDAAQVSLSGDGLRIYSAGFSARPPLPSPQPRLERGHAERNIIDFL